MDNRNEIRDFLTSRRAKITPERAGLPAYGGNRRVTGLRREEVAMLAGVSVDYYTRLERGNAHGASDSVLESLARALQLDEAERAHLFDLVHANTAARNTAARNTAARNSAARNSAGKAGRPARPPVRPSVQRIVDAMAGTPAYVRNGRLDLLAANRLGRALYSPVFSSQAQPANTARFLFLDPAAPEFFTEWERHAQDTVAILRSEAGRHPHDRALSGLIGELSTRSPAFRTWWAAHNVRFHRSGVKHLHHPVVGDLTLSFEALDVAADEGLRISVYTAEPGTPSHDALSLLASWAATIDQAGQPSTPRTS
jgi:transcriptional regulator with XRE-family HTH domain